MADTDKKTEALIGLYLKFSNKKSLSVKEFVEIRKQAVKEQCKGGYVSKNVTRPLENMEGKEKEEPVQHHSKEMRRMEPSSTNVKSGTKERITEDSTDKENLFLSMIRDISD